MTIDQILERVENVKAKSDYWFVRTDYGKYFDEFLDKNCIAIGWDYITLNDLKNSGEEAIKARIAREQKIDASTFGGKVKISTTYNKLKTFISLKKDDIVIIPSRNSDRLAFGRIIDEVAYEEVNAPEFTKRRRVEWMENKRMSDLNPIFYKVKSNQHTISNISTYAPHIDRVIGILFQKDNNTHYVLNIEKTDDINFSDLQGLMSNIEILTRKINEVYGFNENIDELYIKISLQSKGTLELIKAGGKTLAVLAFLVSLTACGNNSTNQESDIQGFMDENKSILDETAKAIDNLKINTQELSAPFVDHVRN